MSEIDRNVDKENEYEGTDLYRSKRKPVKNSIGPHSENYQMTSNKENRGINYDSPMPIKNYRKNKRNQISIIKENNYDESIENQGNHSFNKNREQSSLKKIKTQKYNENSLYNSFNNSIDISDPNLILDYQANNKESENINPADATTMILDNDETTFLLKKKA